ncbi:MAG: DmsE family decaheme c-type cytochrome [Ectothiorhodospira sp.]
MKPHRASTLLIIIIILATWLGVAVANDPDPEWPVRGVDKIPEVEVDRSARIQQHVQRIFESPHAFTGDERTPFAPGNGACNACHGSGMDTLFNIEEETPERLNEPCLECHEEGARRHWKGSAHEFSGLACINCHSMHNTRDKLLKADSQLEVCGSCHLDRRADFGKPSHHPVPEGSMECTDCHNPHGTPGPKLLVGHTRNETCYRCHAEKRGPFLWEHNPAREACTECHDPHGSIHRPLLTTRPPMLCQQCHLGSHSDTALNGAGRDFRVQGRSCLNCHSQVHGTNHPRGRFLTE